MTRFLTFRLLFGMLFGASLVSCKNPSSSTANSPVTGSWPGAAYSSVKAYVYDCDADSSVAFLQKGGRETKGIINKGGAVLSAAQAAKLMSIMKTPTPKESRTACFIPHHAFVFYAPDGSIVGRIEVCFTCDTHRAYPGGLARHVNMGELWNLLGELDVARGEGRKFYQDLYRTTCRMR